MLKRLMAMVVISGFALSSASAQMSLEEKEFKAINTFLAIQIYLSKKDKSEFNFKNLDEVKLPKYTAQAIADDFDENNLAAEKEYSNLSLTIVGKISAVAATPEHVEVTFDTSNFKHGDMDAYLDLEYADIAALFKRNDVVNLSCRGVIGDFIPIAKSCAPIEGSLLVEEKQAEKITKAFLNRENIDKYIVIKNDNGTAAGKIYLYKYAAQFVPNGSACLSWETFSNCQYTKILPNGGKVSETSEYQKSYAEAKQLYHLP
ncbi:OB-fold protein [Bartonella sp. LJL80]